MLAFGQAAVRLERTHSRVEERSLSRHKCCTFNSSFFFALSVVVVIMGSVMTFISWGWKGVQGSLVGIGCSSVV